MMRVKKISAMILTVIMMVSMVPAMVFAAGAKKNGWVQSGSDWYYYQDDKMLKSSWLKYQSQWYYFGTDGKMYSNRSLYDVDKKVYVFKSSGAMVTKQGWVKVKYTKSYETLDRWFYVKKGGVCTTGWKKIDGKWYYFYKNSDEGADFYGIGSMVDVPSAIAGNTAYAFNNNGTLVTKTGWVSLKWKIYTYWFYVKKGGVCTTGWKKIGGKWYYFDYHGPMLSNTSRVIDGKNYTFDKNGVCLNP